MLTFLLSVLDETNHDKMIQIYDSYHDIMMKITRSRLKSQGNSNPDYDSEDIVQETFLRIAIYIFDVPDSAEPKRQKTYVLTMLNNVFSDYFKHTKPADDIEDYADTLGSEENFIEELYLETRYALVVQAIKELSEIYKRTLYYRYTEEMSVNHIAELMGVVPKTVEMRLRRSRGKIRTFVNQ